MVRLRTFVLPVLVLATAATSLHAQDLSRYRGFTLGSTVAAVTTTSATTPADVKVIHQRPMMIQELRWRPQRYSSGAIPADPVREVVFTFYDDKLFLVQVEYDRQRTEGLTDADLIESMVISYGQPVLTSTSLPSGAAPAESERDVVVARWAGAESSVTLLRGTYPTNLRLVLSLMPVEALARSASAASMLQDSDEAPQREIDRQKQLADDRRGAAEKARVLNKPAFRP